MSHEGLQNQLQLRRNTETLINPKTIPPSKTKKRRWEATPRENRAHRTVHPVKAPKTLVWRVHQQRQNLVYSSRLWFFQHHERPHAAAQSLQPSWPLRIQNNRFTLHNVSQHQVRVSSARFPATDYKTRSPCSQNRRNLQFSIAWSSNVSHSGWLHKKSISFIVPSECLTVPKLPESPKHSESSFDRTANSAAQPSIGQAQTPKLYQCCIAAVCSRLLQCSKWEPVLKLHGKGQITF